MSRNTILNNNSKKWKFSSWSRQIVSLAIKNNKPSKLNTTYKSRTFGLKDHVQSVCVCVENIHTRPKKKYEIWIIYFSLRNQSNIIKNVCFGYKCPLECRNGFMGEDETSIWWRWKLQDFLTIVILNGRWGELTSSVPLSTNRLPARGHSKLQILHAYLRHRHGANSKAASSRSQPPKQWQLPI